MIYDVSHRTAIQYAGLVRLAQFNLRLEPAPWPGQNISEYRLLVDPAPSAIRHSDGPYVVRESRLVLGEPIVRLSIESRFRVEVSPPGRDLFSAASPDVAAIREAALCWPDLARAGPASYLFASPIATPSVEIGEWAAPLLADDRPVLEAGQALMAAIHGEFLYDSTATRADTSPIEAFHARHGVCQDFAHVMIVAARVHGIPAAYVSGYLRTEPPPGSPRLIGADAMHAWVALWCGEELGWVGFDPTNNVRAATDHIFVAMGRDFSDVSPLDGVFHGDGGQSMQVAVDVIPLDGEAASSARPDSPQVDSLDADSPLGDPAAAGG